MSKPYETLIRKNATPRENLSAMTKEFLDRTHFVKSTHDYKIPKIENFNNMIYAIFLMIHDECHSGNDDDIINRKMSRTLISNNDSKETSDFIIAILKNYPDQLIDALGGKDGSLIDSDLLLQLEELTKFAPRDLFEQMRDTFKDQLDNNAYAGLLNQLNSPVNQPAPESVINLKTPATSQVKYSEKEQRYADAYKSGGIKDMLKEYNKVELSIGNKSVNIPTSLIGARHYSKAVKKALKKNYSSNVMETFLEEVLKKNRPIGEESEVTALMNVILDKQKSSLVASWGKETNYSNLFKRLHNASPKSTQERIKDIAQQVGLQLDTNVIRDEYRGG